MNNILSSTPDGPVIWYVHPYAGGPGIGRYSRPFSLAHHWRKAGVRATVFLPSYHHLLDAPQPSGCRLVDGVPYEFLASPRYSGNSAGRLRNMFTFAWQMYRRAEEFSKTHGKPAAIVSSSPHPYSFLATHALARRFSAMSVFEVRDLWPLSLIELAGASPGHPFVRFTAWLERYAYRNADRVVSLLPLTCEHMTEGGLQREKWSYIPNGVDIDESVSVDREHPSVRKAQQWKSEGQVVFVYAGALGRPNHLDSLIRAVAKLKEAGDSTVKVIIVGRGEQENELRTLSTTLGIDAHAVLYGQIPKSSVIGLLEAASAGYISLRPEPLFRFGVSPNKLFDYMVAALPVVFAVKAGNDPVGEAQCGVTVSPDDPSGIAEALRAIASLSEALRTEMGERGRQYVLEKHSYEGLARVYLDCLNIRRGPTKSD